MVRWDEGPHEVCEVLGMRTDCPGAGGLMRYARSHTLDRGGGAPPAHRGAAYE